MDIVAWGRLATAVKKAHLLAAPDYSSTIAKEGEGEDEVPIRYISLEWAGFG
jgi:tRNA splicing endonuclease